MIISKEKFVKIINRLKNYKNLQNKIDELFEENIDNREMDFMNAASISISHETIVVDLLENMFETDTISWWIYETDFGNSFSVGDIEEEDGYKYDLSTAEKLYDYLIYSLNERQV